MPEGRLWRAGANEATRVTFSRDVHIDGHLVTAASYTFFAIPRETEWTLILNRVSRQFGAFDYAPAFDALRFAAKPAHTPHHEYLTYSVEPAGAGAAIITLSWGDLAVSFRVEVPA